MNNFARLLVLVLAACGSASADSFTIAGFTPTDPVKLRQNDLATGNSYLDPSRLPSFASAAARSSFDFQKDGYIGTLHLNDSFTRDISSSPTEVAIPEPATLLLFGSGLVAAALRRKRFFRVS